MFVPKPYGGFVFSLQPRSFLPYLLVASCLHEVLLEEVFTDGRRAVVDGRRPPFPWKGELLDVVAANKILCNAQSISWGVVTQGSKGLRYAVRAAASLV